MNSAKRLASLKHRRKRQRRLAQRHLARQLIRGDVTLDQMQRIAGVGATGVLQTVAYLSEKEGFSLTPGLVQATSGTLETTTGSEGPPAAALIPMPPPPTRAVRPPPPPPKGRRGRGRFRRGAGGRPPGAGAPRSDSARPVGTPSPVRSSSVPSPQVPSSDPHGTSSTTPENLQAQKQPIAPKTAHEELSTASEQTPSNPTEETTQTSENG